MIRCTLSFFLPEKLTLLMESHVWPYLPSFSGFFDTITSATFKFWVKFYHHYSNNTSQSHSRPIRVIYSCRGWNGIKLSSCGFYYSVSEWCSELPCQRHAGPHHGRPHPPEPLHINNSLYMANHINNFIYICPIILTTLYIRPENRLLLNSLMKMMSAGIRDKFNIKWELLTIMFFPPTFFLVAFPGGTWGFFCRLLYMLAWVMS